ncbi:sufE-like protein 1, chloroplastic/mitochondrial [Phalaenopsis equestris]|uniref:sufE-like protein 1, chloroplastic/mitochondrial n=1 Tax=Phalaenopsis equestris TaxID=78828 RepID=UPI0009E495A1|nr:sufE-like protein 1, chloroplastic/mitochondrial [Phalaenopsis equestris]
MSSLSFSLRHFSLQLPQNPNPKPFQSIYKTLFLSRCSFSFHRLAPLSSSQLLTPHSHSQQQKSDSSSGSNPSPDEDITRLLPPALCEIVSLFQSVGDDPKAKYQQLLHYGSQLTALDPRFKNNDYRVRGCVSQVWVRAFPDPADPAAVRFEADSDSALTKGLAALLVFGLSGSPASVIASVPPEFILMLGLRQSLTPSRNNGFLNMLLLMQKKAQEIQCLGEEIDFDDEEKNLTTNVNGWRPLDYAESKKTIDGSRPGADETSISSDRDVNIEIGTVDEEGIASEDKFDEGIDNGWHVNDGDVDGDLSSLSGVGETRRERIWKLLERALSPVELDVDDISHLHAGHAGIGGSRSGETHFNVRVVSEEFEGKSMVKRHRLVYDLLQDELQSGLHSLSIVAKTPSEIKGPI